MVGVDEVGRGCWAGPLLVVAARANSKLPGGLKDSKLLSRKQRSEILNLLSICCEFGEGWVRCAEIDRLGLSKALKIGAGRALKNLGVENPEDIILDGKFNYLPPEFINSRAVIKADGSVPIVSAAGIYAKVQRDNYMFELAKKHPSYNFDRHVGYGTKDHQQALSSFGYIEHVHRLSYAPIARMVLSR